MNVRLSQVGTSRSRRALPAGLQSGRATTGSSSPAGPQAPAGTPSARVDLDLVLAHRATQGFTRDVLADIRSTGRAAWLDRQLDPLSIPDPVADAFVARFPTVAMTIGELHAAGFLNDTLTPVEELQQVCVARSVHSERQLLERLVEFWHDHFNVDQVRTLAGRLFFTSFDRDVIRANALGSFETLLVAVAQSASMSDYLDGDSNVVGAPNENFAREVMELHSLGVDGPYTEMDVRELARCFTGWRYARWHEPTPGAFLFDAAVHDDGAKVVLGHQIPPGGGVNDALDMLHELAIHPKTLDYVSRKLVGWFAGYDPPQSAVDRVVAVWQSTSGDLREVVREALSDEVLLLCSAQEAGKLKRPYHFGIALLRQLGVDTSDDYFTTPRVFDLMGQRPYIWRSPDGYPDRIEAWGSDMYSRWKFASQLLDGQLPGLDVSTAALLALRGPAANERLAHRIAQVLAGGRISAAEVDRVQQFIDGRPFDEQVFREAVALVASCPANQMY